jgi:hypothetical protein
MYLIQYGASGVVSCPCGPYSASTVEVPETVPEKRGTLQQKLQTKIGGLMILLLSKGSRLTEEEVLRSVADHYGVKRLSVSIRAQRLAD